MTVASTLTVRQPASPDQRGDAGQQVQAGDVTPARVGRRKVRADVAQARRAEHGVHDRVQPHIGVRMSREHARASV
jgi:hypothetical protein